MLRGQGVPRRRRAFAFVALAAMSVAVAACGQERRATRPQDSLHDDAITIGSFDFAESALLGEVYAQALERAGYRVRRALGLGPREFVDPALSRGLIEFVPEYAGTALSFVSRAAPAAASDAATHAALARALRPTPIDVLDAAPAQDANAFVVTATTAARDGLRTLSDLARVAHGLTIGGPPECPRRPLCLAGLAQRYGVHFKEFVPLDAGGPLTRQALLDRAVDVALLFTSDPAIEHDGLVELQDDRRLQPAENVTPLVRREVVTRWGPRFVATVDAVSRRLTTAELRALNAALAAPGGDATAVARQWLEEPAA